MKMGEVRLYPKLPFLYGLVTFLTVCFGLSSPVNDVSLAEVSRECIEGSAAGDCLQLIFHRYGDSQSITFDKFREFLSNVGLGITETDQDDNIAPGNSSTTDTPTDSVADNAAFIMIGDNHTTDDHLQKAIGLYPSDMLNSSHFLKLCPILLQQIDVHVCTPGSAANHTEHHNELGSARDGQETPHHMREVWGFSIAAVTVISLASLLCILTVPCIQGHPVAFQRLLAFLVALAVGTLLGDAVLHLIPHSFIPHNHETIAHENAPEASHHGNEDTHSAGGTATEQEVIFKGLAVLLGIFAFFIFEQILQYVSEKSGSAGRKQEYRSLPSNQDVIGFKLARQVEEEIPANVSPSSVESGSSFHPCTVQGTDMPLGTPSRQPKLSSSYRYAELDSVKGSSEQQHERDSEMDDRQYKQRSHSGHEHGHSHAFATGEGITSLAWVVVLGDAMHNLCDGLVVGSAFVDSLTGGISTAIAIMCHEVPHELGDFAVMLKAGMSIRQALAVQGISSVLAYVGMAIGIAVGNISSASSWMFAVAAGMFLYIALVDLIPEMVDSTKSSDDSRILQLGLQALGVALGCCLMLLIALSEKTLLVLLGG